MKSGNLNFLEPSGPLQAGNGAALHFFFYSRRVDSTDLGILWVKVLVDTKQWSCNCPGCCNAIYNPLFNINTGAYKCMIFRYLESLTGYDWSQNYPFKDEHQSTLQRIQNTVRTSQRTECSSIQIKIVDCCRGNQSLFIAINIWNTYINWLPWCWTWRYMQSLPFRLSVT
jgi:hypothetical protein